VPLKLIIPGREQKEVPKEALVIEKGSWEALKIHKGSRNCATGTLLED